MNPAKNVAETQNDSEWEVVVEPFPETFPFENSGDTLQGKYVSNRITLQDVLNKPGEKRETTVYTIEDELGKKWGVWSSWAIDEAFNKIEVGNLVRITYGGTETINNGAQTVKKFVVAHKRN